MSSGGKVGSHFLIVPRFSFRSMSGEYEAHFIKIKKAIVQQGVLSSSQAKHKLMTRISIVVPLSTLHIKVFVKYYSTTLLSNTDVKKSRWKTLTQFKFVTDVLQLLHNLSQTVTKIVSFDLRKPTLFNSCLAAFSCCGQAHGRHRYSAGTNFAPQLPRPLLPFTSRLSVKWCSLEYILNNDRTLDTHKYLS